MASTSADVTADRYLCEICNRLYETKHSLSYHRRKYHTDKMLYTCSSCEYKTLHMSHLKEHRTCMHSEKQIRCTICEIDVNSKYEFVQHQSEHKSPTSSNKFICHKCYPTKTFNAFSILEKHDSTVHSFLKCNVCGKQFQHRADLIDHMKNHTEDFPFQCDVCYNRYMQEGRCANHMKKMHRRQSCEA